MLPIATGAIAYVALLSAGQKLLNDPDTLWHITAGRWIFEHQSVPYTDPFSHTLAGQPWTAHEWLAECLTAVLYDTFGWTGLVVGGALAGAAAFAILAHLLLRYLTWQIALPSVAVGFLLSASHMTARPHLFAMPLLVLWIAGLVTARAQDRAPSLWLLPVMALWANLHGGFIIGLGLCCALAAEAVLASPVDARMKAVRVWGLFTAGAFAASLVTPHGVGGWLFPFYLLSLDFSLEFVAEWHAPDFSQFQPIELWFAGFAVLIALSRPRVSAIRVVLLLGIAYMAVTHARNAELLALVAPPLLAPSFGRTYPPQAASSSPRTEHALAALAICAVIGVSLLATLKGYERSDPAANALAAALEAKVEGPVLNDYDFGGYLIFSGIPVFVDGRVDLYGDDFMRAYARAVLDGDDTLPTLLEQHRINWTLLRPSDAAVKALDDLAGWQRIYTDDGAVVHRRVKVPSDQS